MLLLVEANWKQFWKVRQSTSWKTATTEDLHSTKHSSKCTFTPLGATVPVIKTNDLRGNFSLGGTVSTGMTVFGRSRKLFWKSPNAPPWMRWKKGKVYFLQMVMEVKGTSVTHL